MPKKNSVHMRCGILGVLTPVLFDIIIIERRQFMCKTAAGHKGVIEFS